MSAIMTNSRNSSEGSPRSDETKLNEKYFDKVVEILEKQIDKSEQTLKETIEAKDKEIEYLRQTLADLYDELPARNRKKYMNNYWEKNKIPERKGHKSSNGNWKFERRCKCSQP